MLDRHHAARREALAVPDPIHLVDDRHLGVAAYQEIGVQRMRRAAFHGASGGDQRLPDHLPAEHALPTVLRRAAANKFTSSCSMLSTSSMVWTADDMDWPVLIGASHDGWAGMSRRAPGTRRALVVCQFALLLRADQPRLDGRIRIGAAGRAVLARARQHCAADAHGAHHHLVGAALRDRVGRHEHAQRRARIALLTLLAAIALRPERALRAGIALRAGDALLSALADRSCRSALALRALIALRAGGADRTRITLRSGRTGRADIALRAGATDRTRIALRPRRTGRADVALRARNALRSAFTLRPGRSGGAGIALRTETSPLAPCGPALPCGPCGPSGPFEQPAGEATLPPRLRSSVEHAWPPSLCGMPDRALQWMPDCPPFYAPPGSTYMNWYCDGMFHIMCERCLTN